MTLLYETQISLHNVLTCRLAFLCLSEMAERHDAKQVLKIARELILRQQTLIDNK